MEAFIRALFGNFQVKLTGIEYDVYKVISMNCDIETQLQLRSVSQGFRSLIKEVNPDLFRQLLEQSYICSNSGGLCSVYSHLFPDYYSPKTLEECVSIPSLLTMNYYEFPHYIVRKLRNTLGKVIDQADVETLHGYIFTLMYAFMTGENILEKWTKSVEIVKDILPISKQNLLRCCAYIGNIESYKLLCLYYPLPEQIVEVDTELWLNQQALQPEDAVSLFILLLTAERFDLCDAMFQPHLLENISISSQKVYDYIRKRDPNIRISSEMLCSVPDIQLEDKKYHRECINFLFENHRFDILRKQKPELNQCSNIGQALYFGYKPFYDLHKITNKELLTHALIYDDRIRWKELAEKAMMAEAISPVLVKEFVKRKLL